MEHGGARRGALPIRRIHIGGVRQGEVECRAQRRGGGVRAAAGPLAQGEAAAGAGRTQAGRGPHKHTGADRTRTGRGRDRFSQQDAWGRRGAPFLPLEPRSLAPVPARVTLPCCSSAISDNGAAGPPSAPRDPWGRGFAGTGQLLFYGAPDVVQNLVGKIGIRSIQTSAGTHPDLHEHQLASAREIAPPEIPGTCTFPWYFLVDAPDPGPGAGPAGAGGWIPPPPLFAAAAAAIRGNPGKPKTGLPFSGATLG
eukprot:gene25631-biopygen10525